MRSPARPYGSRACCVPSGLATAEVVGDPSLAESPVAHAARLRRHATQDGLLVAHVARVGEGRTADRTPGPVDAAAGPGENGRLASASPCSMRGDTARRD